MYQLIWKSRTGIIKVDVTGKWIYFSQADLLGIQVTWTTPGVFWFKDKIHIKYIDDTDLDIVYNNQSEG